MMYLYGINKYIFKYVQGVNGQVDSDSVFLCEEV